jgi:hypothetical protein
VKSLLKETPVQVMLDQADLQDIDRLVPIEAQEQKDSRVGRATVLREYAMPAIRRRLAEIDAAAKPATVPDKATARRTA